MNDAEKQSSEKMLKTGVVGSVVAAICCFTPLLVLFFTGVGLSGLVGGLDYVLFPILFASLGLVALALYFRAGSPGPSPRTIIFALVVMFSVGLIWLEFFYAIRISIAAVVMVAAYWFYLRSARSQPVS